MVDQDGRKFNEQGNRYCRRLVVNKLLTSCRCCCILDLMLENKQLGQSLGIDIDSESCAFTPGFDIPFLIKHSVVWLAMAASFLFNLLQPEIASIMFCKGQSTPPDSPRLLKRVVN